MSRSPVQSCGLAAVKGFSTTQTPETLVQSDSYNLGKTLAEREVRVGRQCAISAPVVIEMMAGSQKKSVAP
jgi:hypothetical protein